MCCDSLRKWWHEIWGMGLREGSKHMQFWKSLQQFVNKSAYCLDFFSLLSFNKSLLSFSLAHSSFYLKQRFLESGSLLNSPKDLLSLKTILFVPPRQGSSFWETTKFKGRLNLVRFGNINFCRTLLQLVFVLLGLCPLPWFSCCEMGWSIVEMRVHLHACVGKQPVFKQS